MYKMVRFNLIRLIHPCFTTERPPCLFFCQPPPTTTTALPIPLIIMLRLQGQQRRCVIESRVVEGRTR